MAHDHATATVAPTAQRPLSARHLVFFVIASAAPLAFSLAATPLAIGRGGIGIVGAFLATAALLAVFSVGYVVMAGHVRRAGGLYEYVAVGLGRRLGVGAAFVAVVAYAAAATGAVGVFAVFANAATADLLGFELPWAVWALAAAVAMGALGILSIELNARLLGLMIALEVGILLVVAGAIVVGGGADGLSAAPLAPGNVFTEHPGALFAIAISAFAGFEATVIFSGEVADRARTIRRATLTAIALMAALYGLVSWALVMAYGDGAVAAAQADPVSMFFGAAQTYVGSWAVQALEVLVVTSWFASVLAFHNATARYVAALGRDGVLPRRLGDRHPRFGSPWRASLLHSGLTVAVVAAFALGHADPYLDLYVIGSTPAVIGIPVLELLASLAILAFFARSRRGHSLWTVRVAPAVAALGLAAMVTAIALQVDLFTARDGAINVALPGVIAVALIVGVLRGSPIRPAPEPAPRPERAGA